MALTLTLNSNKYSIKQADLFSDQDGNILEEIETYIKNSLSSRVEKFAKIVEQKVSSLAHYADS